MGLSQPVSIAGAALVLGAFAALQFRRTHAYSRPYLVANVVGSAFLAAAAALEGLWAFVTLNSVWGLVSLRSLFRTPADVRAGTERSEPAEADRGTGSE